MHPGLSLGYWLTLHGLVTLVAVLLYVITAHVLRQRRHPTAAIAWVLFILLMPYAALPAFLLFGSRKQARPRPRPAPDPFALDEQGSWAVQTAIALGQGTPCAYRALHVHAGGDAAAQALWQIIAGARRSLDLCTFIIGRDAFGSAVIERLAAKARAGVQVRVLLDGLGYWMGHRPDLAPLRAAGVRVTLFVPPLHSPLKGRSNLRDHRKLLIADAGQPDARLWCGGRNLAADYFEDRNGRPAWRDLSFDLQGALVGQAHELFEHDWTFAVGRRAIAAGESASGHSTLTPPQDAQDPLFARTLPAPELVARRHGLSAPGLPGAAGPFCAGGLDEDGSPQDDGAGGATGRSAQIIASGPDQVEDTVYSLLVTAAYRAHEHIALVTPYFVPDAALLQALCLASRRGVAVELLLPARSNHLMSDFARTRALRALAAAGARIWLAPRMLHAKLVLVDEALALAGSANIDSRSLFLNYEMMVAFHDHRAIRGFAAWFEHERDHAREYLPPRAGLLRDIGEGLVLSLGFQL